MLTHGEGMGAANFDEAKDNTMRITMGMGEGIFRADLQPYPRRFRIDKG
jgi:hypothetical protein